MHVKAPKIDPRRRWASLQLCFNAKGPKIRPGICFRLAPKKLAGGSLDNSLPAHKDTLAQHKVLTQQYPDVDIYYQPKAWFDTSTCMAFARRFCEQTKNQRGEKLLGADNLNGQACPDFREFMFSKCKTIIAFTPPDCTDLCAVTDSHIGRTIKWRMKKYADADFDLRPTAYPFYGTDFCVFFV